MANTNALVIAIQIEGENLTSQEVLNRGLEKLLSLCQNRKKLETFLGKGTPESKITLLRDIPDFEDIDISGDRNLAREICWSAMN